MSAQSSRKTRGSNKFERARKVRAAIATTRFILAGALALGLTAASVFGTQDTGPQHLQRGLALLDAGRVAEAVEELESAVSEQPQDPIARYHLGRALFTLGRAEDAVEHLEVARDLAPEPGPVYFLLGQVWLETGDFAAAHQALEAAAESRPGYPPIDLYRAELCYRLGQVGTARQRLAALVEAAPEWTPARVRSGTLALEQGDTAEAVRWYRSAVEIAPENPDLWTRLGRALVDDEQPNEALSAYREAAKLSPGNATALATVALQLINLGEHEAALAAVDDVLAADPHQGIIRYQRAELLSREGRHEEALEEVRKAVDDLRGSAVGEARGTRGVSMLAEANLTIAELLVRLGQEDEGLAIARDLVASEPDFPDALFLLGNTLVRRQDRTGQEYLERFKTLSDAREHRELGDQFRLRERDPERARVEYERALRSNPDDRGALLGLGAVQRQSGEIDGALETLARAREAGAGGAEWHREWVLALHAAGRTIEADAAWERARSEGFTLGPQVWSVLRPRLGIC